MLPIISGEFGVVNEPEIRFTDKGGAWVKIRGIAKDRVRDANGTWGDGDPLFIDIIVNAKTGAENLYESVAKGDTVIVTGKLKQREYEKDGQKRVEYQIRAESIGVGTRWATAKTPRSVESVSGVDAAKDALGAVEIEQTEAPF